MSWIIPRTPQVIVHIKGRLQGGHGVLVTTGKCGIHIFDNVANASWVIDTWVRPIQLSSNRIAQQNLGLLTKVIPSVEFESFTQSRRPQVLIAGG